MAVNDLPEVAVEFAMFLGIKFCCPNCGLDHEIPDPKLAYSIRMHKPVVGTCHKCGQDFKFTEKLVVMP